MKRGIHSKGWWEQVVFAIMDSKGKQEGYLHYLLYIISWYACLGLIHRNKRMKMPRGMLRAT